MTLYISDSVIDTIKIKRALRRSLSCVTVSFDDSAPEEIRAIKDYLESVGFFTLHLCAQASQEQSGSGNDTAGMRYLSLEDGSPQGVKFPAYFGLREPIAEVIVSNEAADRLLTRFFDLMIQIAKLWQHEILQDWRWQDFLVAAAAVKQRVLSCSSTHN